MVASHLLVFRRRIPRQRCAALRLRYRRQTISEPIRNAARRRSFVFYGECAVGGGAFNLAVGYVLVLRVGDFHLRNTTDAVAIGLGILALGVPLARRFGRFNGGNLGSGLPEHQ